MENGKKVIKSMVFPGWRGYFSYDNDLCNWPENDASQPKYSLNMK